jgi:hypothetical protein
VEVPADGEHALAHGEVEDVEGGHSPTVVRRFPADVLDCEVDGERRGPIRRQLELAGREDEVLGAVDGLKPVVRQREARNRHLHLTLADRQLRVGVERDVLVAGRQRQARRAPASSVEVRPPELVVGGEVVVSAVRHRIVLWWPAHPDDERGAGKSTPLRSSGNQASRTAS